MQNGWQLLRKTPHRILPSPFQGTNVRKGTQEFTVRSEAEIVATKTAGHTENYRTGPDCKSLGDVILLVKILPTILA